MVINIKFILIYLIYKLKRNNMTGYVIIPIVYLSWQ